jgi:lysophospholipase L1-like esterase
MDPTMKKQHTNSEIADRNETLFAINLRKRFLFRVGMVVFALVAAELVGQLLFWGMDAVEQRAKAARPQPSKGGGCNHPNESTCPKQPFQADQNEAILTDPYSGHLWLPGYEGKWLSINQMGYRGPHEFEMPKPEGVYRIVMIGGSAAFGVGVHDEETIEYYLQDLLNRQHDQPVEVINAGMTGYNSTQELTLLAVHILDLDPDLVIIYDGHNDLYFGLSPRWVEDYSPAMLDEIQLLQDALVNVPEPEQERVPFIYTPVGSFLINKVALGRLTHKVVYEMKNRLFPAVEERLAKDDTSDPAAQLRIHPQALDVYARNLERMVILLRGHDVGTIMAFQPSLTAGEKVPTEEEEGYIKLARERGHFDLMVEFYPSGVETMQQVGAEMGVPVYDFTPIFDDETGWMYLDTMHLTADGNRMVAERLAAIIVALLEE